MHLNILHDKDGTLVPIEFYELPFKPKRVFYVTDVPKGEVRGGHAHHETQQILVCINGRILVSLHDGSLLTERILEKHEGIFVDKMIWDTQKFLTDNDVLLSLCSTNYGTQDYINNFSEFLELKRWS